MPAITLPDVPGRPTQLQFKPDVPGKSEFPGIQHLERARERGRRKIWRVSADSNCRLLSQQEDRRDPP